MTERQQVIRGPARTPMSSLIRRRLSEHATDLHAADQKMHFITVRSCSPLDIGVPSAVELSSTQQDRIFAVLGHLVCLQMPCLSAPSQSNSHCR